MLNFNSVSQYVSISFYLFPGIDTGKLFLANADYFLNTCDDHKLHLEHTIVELVHIVFLAVLQYRNIASILYLQYMHHYTILEPHTKQRQSNCSA